MPKKITDVTPDMTWEDPHPDAERIEGKGSFATLINEPLTFLRVSLLPQFLLEKLAEKVGSGVRETYRVVAYKGLKEQEKVSFLSSHAALQRTWKVMAKDCNALPDNGESIDLDEPVRGVIREGRTAKGRRIYVLEDWPEDWENA